MSDPATITIELAPDAVLHHGRVLARRGESGWHAADGRPVDQVTIPTGHAARPPVDQARRRAWLAGALEDLRGLAQSTPLLTTDDVLAALSEAPEDPRSQLSQLMNRGRAAGWLVATTATRRSTRGVCGGRRLRVWRSTLHERHAR